MKMATVREMIPGLEERLTATIEEFEKTTGCYVADMWIQRDQPGKPWLLKVRTVISVNEPDD